MIYKLLAICEHLGDKQKIITTNINIGHLFLSQSNYEKAIEYFKKALEYNQRLGFSRTSMK